MTRRGGEGGAVISVFDGIEWNACPRCAGAVGVPPGMRFIACECGWTEFSAGCYTENADEWEEACAFGREIARRIDAGEYECFAEGKVEP